MNIPLDVAAAASLKASVGTMVVVVVVAVVVPVVLIVSNTGVVTDEPSSLTFFVPNADINVIAAILSSSVVVVNEVVDNSKFPVDEVEVDDTDRSKDDPPTDLLDAAVTDVAFTASTGG